MVKSAPAIKILFCTISLLLYCSSTKSATYFDDLYDSLILAKIANLEPIIHMKYGYGYGYEMINLDLGYSQKNKAKQLKLVPSKVPMAVTVA